MCSVDTVLFSTLNFDRGGGGTMSNVAEIQVQQQTNRKIISKC